ncbi:hypothetical protein Tco_1367921 [Tanacetum coccineum]
MWVEEEDGEWVYFLGGNSSSGTKKYRGSNSSDSGNIGDGVKIASEVIGSGDGIEFSEELKELLPVLKVSSDVITYSSSFSHSVIFLATSMFEFDNFDSEFVLEVEVVVPGDS